MITDVLIQYGALGIFVIYLIYDRQVILKRFEESINKNTQVTQDLINLMEVKRNGRNK